MRDCLNPIQLLVVGFGLFGSGEAPMRGTMMDYPLTLPAMLERTGKLFGRVEIVSRRPDRSIVRTTYGDFYRRARRLASALTKLGLRRALRWRNPAYPEFAAPPE
jgi:hypothetical protein